MRSKILGIIAFFVALSIGIQAVMLASMVIVQFALPAADVITAIDEENELLAMPLNGVNIIYKGLNSSTSDLGPTMVFIIFNGSSETIECVGYSGICASPEILIAGKDEKGWVCMNGSSRYSILPGQTAELMVGPHDLATLPDRSAQVIVGYKFQRSNDGPVTYYAEPIVLPTKFRSEVKNELDGLRVK